MRSPPPAGEHLLRAILLLVALLSVCDSKLDTDRMVPVNQQYRPPRAPGGPFQVTPPAPNPDFRWTFEGVDYDNPPHQTTTFVAKQEVETCEGQYVRCLLRDSKFAEICAGDYTNNQFNKFYSICEVEYYNCRTIHWNYKGHAWTDFRMNRFLYEGEGWWSVKDTGYDGSWWLTWYCYWLDIQYAKMNMRRAAAGVWRLLANIANIAALTDRPLHNVTNIINNNTNFSLD